MVMNKLKSFLVGRRKAGDQWLSKHLGGHVNVGPFTIFGFNSMHVVVTFHTNRLGHIELHPSLRFLGSLAPWHIGPDYPWGILVSPNGTPDAATFLFGPRYTTMEKLNSTRRRILFGHNFNIDELDYRRE